MEYHRDPRPHYLHRGAPGRPLIVALHGFTQFVGPPTSWRPWNFVRLSGLHDMAVRAGCSVCFPVGRWRNWGKRDAKSVVDLSWDCLAKYEANRVYYWGFSDGATLAIGLQIFGDAIVAHSGLWPRWLGKGDPGEFSKPLLLVCGADDRTPVARQQADIERRYREAGRDVERWEIPNLGHAWARSYNERFLAWCEGNRTF